jgi:signal transduction histidine kinase
LARLQAGAQEQTYALIAPVQRIGEVVAAFRRTCGAAVTVADDGGEAGVAIDPEAFDTVVTHLLTNAVEASSSVAADGTARAARVPAVRVPAVRVPAVRVPAVRVVVRHEALSVLVDIIDEGPGMSADFIRDRLFRPFATTKTGGHGIGAYQARELLRAAGGDLLVLSRPDAGTTMRLLLPSVRVPSAETSEVSA